MMQMLTGAWVTQIAGSVASYSIADHLAKGPATAEQIAALEGIDPNAAFRLLRACASLGLATFDGVAFHTTSLLVHQVRDWFSGAAAYFGWMREAKRENTRCGLRPMSDKAASQKTRSPEGCDENGPAAALLLSHVSIQICSFVAPCRRPILIATPLNQSRTWCTRI
jgi:hypothetical protein